MARSILVLELNELCPPLIERYMASGDLPAFRRLRDESTSFITDPEEPQEHLNPWVQWVTVHTGAGYDDHGVFKLGEGSGLALPTVADVVTRAGRDVWLCGPMNVVPQERVRGAWLPDPWNPDRTAVPEELEAFASFVQANVQEHTNVAHRLSPRAHARFIAFMAQNGLSARTVTATVGQLAGEKLGRRERWRRAALLDRFQWDLFVDRYRQLRPAFATYFSNTTAHYQHVYWRYMDPEPFSLKPTDDERERFGDAIRFGYREMDRIVGQALDLIDDDTALVLCTAISQQPYLLQEEGGGKHFHRPYDVRRLVAQLGLGGVRDVSPVMSEQFHVIFDSESSARAGAEALSGAVVGLTPAFAVRRTGADVLVGCSIMREVEEGALLEVSATGVRLAFHQAFYRSETPKSGYHHPDGALWIRIPGVQGTKVTGRVPLRSVAPTLLRLLGLTPPPSMSTPALDVEPARS